MPLNNNERLIRFSNSTLEEYNELLSKLNNTLIESLHDNHNFQMVYENAAGNLKTKAQLKREAEVLAKNSDNNISKFGKAILEFLAKGVRVFNNLCIAISAVLLVGGIVLSACISIIISILMFAVMTLPPAMVIKGLGSINKVIGDKVDKKDDINVKKYKKISKTIETNINKEGFRNPDNLMKITKISEALDIIKDKPEIIANTESASILKNIEILEHKIENINESSLYGKMRIYENLCPNHLVYEFNNDSVLESVSFNDETDLFMTLENVVSKPLLSGKGLLNGLIAISTDVCNEKTILEFLNRYKNTVHYELMNENYNDLPILMETGLCLNYIRKCCYDVPEVLENCDRFDQLLGEIIIEEKTTVYEDGTGFNPDPCSLGSLTPFPVADRAVANVVCDINNAETDDEITEAMINLGRIAPIINENYKIETDVTEGVTMIIQEDLAKTARNVETKSQEKFSKVATKDNSNTVRTAVKHAIDPMERWIQSKYNDLKEADMNERKKIVMSGGGAGSIIKKVWRWVKRGIGIIIGGVVGQYIPAVAIITGITFIGTICTDAYLDRKARASIMRDLEDEIMICNEKIDDSRGDDNKQKKYELMRIRNSLERQRDKIKYGLEN